MASFAQQNAAMDSNHQDFGGGGSSKADKHYQFVFSSDGNPAGVQGLRFCNLDCDDKAKTSSGGNESSGRSRKRIHEISSCAGSESSKKKAASREERSDEDVIDTNLDDAERLLAGALMNISMQDRERAMEDLHGVRTSDSKPSMSASATEAFSLGTASAIHADPRLKEMQSILQQKSNEAYELAMNQSPAYVQDPNICLSFLNTFGTAKTAADKMLQFLEIKLNHFGPDALCREITMRDLDDSTRACLEGGFYQYLGTDSAGRRVVGTFPMLLKYNSLADVVKMEFYWWTSLFPLYDSGNRDLVVVQYSRGMSDPKPTSMDISVIRAQHKQFCVMPIKYGAWHIVLESRHQKSVAFQVIKIISSSALNIRTMFHFGNHVEVQYELRRFGINTDPMTFPVSHDGVIDPSIHQRYLHHLKEKEGYNEADEKQQPAPVAAAISSELIVGTFPTHRDVLFGRGFNIQHHVGNVRFREFLGKFYQSYTDADNPDKIVLVDHLSSQLRSQLGVRFLRLVNSDPTSGKKMWVEETDNLAIRSKFFQAFRNLRASYRRAAEQRNNQKS